MEKIVSLIFIFLLQLSQRAVCQTHWTCDEHAYRYDMTLYLTPWLDGKAMTSLDGYELAAFYGDECRGLAEILAIPGTEVKYGYMRIRSNMTSGETITFRLYNTSTQEERLGITTISFLSQSVLGMPSNPTKLVLAPASTVNYSIKATNRYGTLVLPFDAPIPAGIKAYTFKSYSNNTVRLTEAESLQAYTPYLLYAPQGAAGTLTGTVNITDYVEVAGSGMLKGAVVQQERAEGYILQNKTGTPMFYNMNSQQFTIPAGRCWLELESGAKSLAVQLDDLLATTISATLPSGKAEGTVAATLPSGKAEGTVAAPVPSAFPEGLAAPVPSAFPEGLAAPVPPVSPGGLAVTPAYKGIVILNGKKYITK